MSPWLKWRKEDSTPGTKQSVEHYYGRNLETSDYQITSEEPDWRLPLSKTSRGYEQSDCGVFYRDDFRVCWHGFNLSKTNMWRPPAQWKEFAGRQLLCIVRAQVTYDQASTQIDTIEVDLNAGGELKPSTPEFSHLEWTTPAAYGYMEYVNHAYLLVKDAQAFANAVVRVSVITSNAITYIWRATVSFLPTDVSPTDALVPWGSLEMGGARESQNGYTSDPDDDLLDYEEIFATSSLNAEFFR